MMASKLGLSQVRKIIAEHLAPQDLWQEAAGAGHPDVGPILLQNQICFTKLMQSSANVTGSSRLPPQSRLDAASLAAAAVPLLPEPRALTGAGKALLALAAGLASRVSAALR